MIKGRIKPNKIFPPGHILKNKGHIRIVRFLELPKENQQVLYKIFDVFELNIQEDILEDGQDIEFIEGVLPVADIARAVKKGRLDTEKMYQKVERIEIDFHALFEKAKCFAAFLEQNTANIRESLKHYETFNVVIDEIERSTEHLKNLDKNRKYFENIAPPVATFLPLNQPLYALVCFGVVPAMMCREVYIRPPTFAHHTFQLLQKVLVLDKWFGNLQISYENKDIFIDKTKKNVEGVIFVGSPKNTAKVRRSYPSNVLFMANGSGHNPIVIGKNAEIDNALQSLINVTLYNQGQDCCSPNTILIHDELSDVFLKKLITKLRSIKHLVGSSENDSNIVGPNTNKPHTIYIAEIFVKNSHYHVYGGDINPTSGLIKPTVFLKPLAMGANYEEFFAPVFFIQTYTSQDELRNYFFSEKYCLNAMYLTIYGEFSLVPELIKMGLHDNDNIIIDSDLHKEEKGFKPYGGLGVDASCIYLEGRRKPSSILPQREIYTYMVKKTKLTEKSL